MVARLARRVVMTVVVVVRELMMVMVMIMGVSVSLLMGMITRVAVIMFMVMNMMGMIVALESAMTMSRVSHRSECQRRAVPVAPELEELRRQQIDTNQSDQGVTHAFELIDQALI